MNDLQISAPAISNREMGRGDNIRLWHVKQKSRMGLPLKSVPAAA